MTGLASKEIRRVLKAAERAGVMVVETRKGWQFRFPDGSSTSLHRTESDSRSALNLRARFRRAGVPWPLD
jgi:hypothetical protein